MTAKIAALTIPALLMIALTGCAPTGGGGAVGGATPTLTGADCIPGDWTADLDDLGAQIAAYFVEKGLGDDLDVSVTGAEKATFNADGTAVATDDAVFTFVGTRGAVAMTMTQTHEGGFTSDWRLTGDTFDFQNFDGAHYKITTTIDINGTSTTSPVQTDDYADDIPITTDCTGDVLIMKPENSPFTTTWHRD